MPQTKSKTPIPIYQWHWPLTVPRHPMLILLHGSSGDCAIWQESMAHCVPYPAHQAWTQPQNQPEYNPQHLQKRHQSGKPRATYQQELEEKSYPNQSAVWHVEWCYLLLKCDELLDQETIDGSGLSVLTNLGDSGLDNQFKLPLIPLRTLTSFLSKSDARLARRNVGTWAGRSLVGSWWLTCHGLVCNGRRRTVLLAGAIFCRENLARNSFKACSYSGPMPLVTVSPTCEPSTPTSSPLRISEEVQTRVLTTLLEASLTDLFIKNPVPRSWCVVLSIYVSQHFNQLTFFGPRQPTWCGFTLWTLELAGQL